MAVHPGDCWKCGNDTLPQTFEVQLNDAKAAGQLVFKVIEGLECIVGCGHSPEVKLLSTPLVIIIFILTLHFLDIEGVSSKTEFADPASFRFEGKMSPSTEWVPLFMISNAAQHKGRDLVFNFDNRVPFNFYRMVIFKTMSNHPKAKPTIGGLRLMECFVAVQPGERIGNKKIPDKLDN